ncbi:MAG: cytochrome c-type biogenesis protein CcmH, partial [Brevundimonas sp.]|nr:cytochrome c-type biogenesis protein CcmH [Brevundimonas sp.]
MKRALLIAVAALGLIATPIAAQEPAPAPDRPLPDAAQEARARALFEDIRCVVCQHEAITDSPAG